MNTYSTPSDLKITDLRVAEITGIPKHCILLKIFTNQGVVGYGECRDASSATYVLMLKSRLLGENPLQVEKLFRRVCQFGGHSRQGGGVSGIEIALLDIVGKVYGIPVYQLLGGKYRDRVRVYCDTDVDGKHTGKDMGEALKKRMEAGFTFLKMDLGIELLYDEPGCVNAPAGMLDEYKKYSMKAISHQSGSIDRSLMLGKNYEVFTVPHHATGLHLTEKGLDYLEDYVAQVRGVIGCAIPLAIDHLGHIAPEDVIRLSRRLEKYNIAWLEDVTPWQYPDHLRRIAEATTIPLCTGEDIYLAESFEPLFRAGAVSVVHPDLLTIGGAMQIKVLGNLCDRYGVAMAIHMAESPIACMAAVHCAAALQNVLCVEYHSADCPSWADIVRGLPKPFIKDGFIEVPEKPGLGIDELNEELIAAHLHGDHPVAWAPTDEWNHEWSNDRPWS